LKIENEKALALREKITQFEIINPQLIAFFAGKK
jgi:hypothetical protein